MSREKQQKEAHRWIQTAREDLETAEILFEKERYAHCCFHCQQAGEKAIFSMHMRNSHGVILC